MKKYAIMIVLLLILSNITLALDTQDTQNTPDTLTIQDSTSTNCDGFWGSVKCFFIGNKENRAGKGWFDRENIAGAASAYQTKLNTLTGSNKDILVRLNKLYGEKNALEAFKTISKGSEVLIKVNSNEVATVSQFGFQISKSVLSPGEEPYFKHKNTEVISVNVMNDEGRRYKSLFTAGLPIKNIPKYLNPKEYTTEQVDKIAQAQKRFKSFNMPLSLRVKLLNQNVVDQNAINKGNVYTNAKSEHVPENLIESLVLDNYAEGTLLGSETSPYYNTYVITDGVYNKVRITPTSLGFKSNTEFKEFKESVGTVGSDNVKKAKEFRDWQNTQEEGADKSATAWIKVNPQTKTLSSSDSANQITKAGYTYYTDDEGNVYDTKKNKIPGIIKEGSDFKIQEGYAWMGDPEKDIRVIKIPDNLPPNFNHYIVRDGKGYFIDSIAKKNNVFDANGDKVVGLNYDKDSKVWTPSDGFNWANDDESSITVVKLSEGESDTSSTPKSAAPSTKKTSTVKKSYEKVSETEDRIEVKSPSGKIITYLAGDEVQIGHKKLKVYTSYVGDGDKSTPDGDHFVSDGQGSFVLVTKDSKGVWQYARRTKTGVEVVDSNDIATKSSVINAKKKGGVSVTFKTTTGTQVSGATTVTPSSGEPAAAKPKEPQGLAAVFGVSSTKVNSQPTSNPTVVTLKKEIATGTSKLKDIRKDRVTAAKSLSQTTNKLKKLKSDIDNEFKESSVITKLDPAIIKIYGAETCNSICSKAVDVRSKVLAKIDYDKKSKNLLAQQKKQLTKLKELKAQEAALGKSLKSKRAEVTAATPNSAVIVSVPDPKSCSEKNNCQIFTEKLDGTKPVKVMYFADEQGNMYQQKLTCKVTCTTKPNEIKALNVKIPKGTTLTGESKLLNKNVGAIVVRDARGNEQVILGDKADNTKTQTPLTKTSYNQLTAGFKGSDTIKVSNDGTVTTTIGKGDNKITHVRTQPDKDLGDKVVTTTTQTKKVIDPTTKKSKDVKEETKETKFNDKNGVTVYAVKEDKDAKGKPTTTITGTNGRTFKPGKNWDANTGSCSSGIACLTAQNGDFAGRALFDGRNNIYGSEPFVGITQGKEGNVKRELRFEKKLPNGEIRIIEVDQKCTTKACDKPADLLSDVYDNGNYVEFRTTKTKDGSVRELNSAQIGTFVLIDEGVGINCFGNSCEKKIFFSQDNDYACTTKPCIAGAPGAVSTNDPNWAKDSGICGSTDTLCASAATQSQSDRGYALFAAGQSKSQKAVKGFVKDISRWGGISNALFGDLYANELSNNIDRGVDKLGWFNYPATQISSVCDATPEDLQGDGFSLIETPGGQIVPVASIQAEMFPQNTDMVCLHNQDPEAKEEFTCPGKLTCGDDQFCYNDKEERVQAYFYKISWGVTAPVDVTFTPYRDESSAVEFNLYLGEIRLNNIPIKLQNGENDGNKITHFSNTDYKGQPVCIKWRKAPRTLRTFSKTDSYEVPDVCTTMKIAEHGTITFTTGDEVSSVSVQSGEVKLSSNW